MGYNNTVACNSLKKNSVLFDRLLAKMLLVQNLLIESFSKYEADYK